MAQQYEIRADHDANAIVIYQAYSPAIARPVLRASRFVPPFSLGRMTWIKPSFLWLMHRSNWGQKAGQENVLAVRITRKGWEEALSLGVLTSPEPAVFRDYHDWQQQFERARVHVQWDPERSLRGGALPYNSIQVGLGRQVIRRYVEEWVVEIRDCTPLVRKIYNLLRAGQAGRAKQHLPPERVYPLDPALGRRFLMANGRR